MSLAKWCSAIHTTSGLDLAFHVRVSDIHISFWDGVNLSPVLNTNERIAVGFGVCFVIQKSAKLLNAFHTSVTTPYSVDVSKVNKSEYIHIFNRYNFEITTKWAVHPEGNHKRPDFELSAHPETQRVDWFAPASFSDRQEKCWQVSSCIQPSKPIRRL
jgi:hypothetical protein